MNPFDNAELSAIATLLDFVGILWLEEVKKEQLELLQSDSVRPHFESLGGHVPENDSSAQLEQLATEYCELLVGPKGHVSPIQSIWEEHQYEGETAVSMLQFAELVPEFTLNGSLPDHIGNQLRFLATLYQIQPPFDSLADIQSRFVSLHLAWSRRFFESAIRKSSSEFYTGLAEVSRSICRELHVYA